jgi:thymidylate kinase
MRQIIPQLNRKGEVLDSYIGLASLIYDERSDKNILDSAAKVIGTSTLREYLELCGLNYDTSQIEEHEGIKFEDFHKKTISLDGINGSGKSTLANILRRMYNVRGISTKIVRPIVSKSVYGKITKSLFRDMFLSFDVFSDTLVLLADYGYVVNKVVPKIKEDLIIFNRSKYSIIAIQSARMFYDEKVDLDNAIDICCKLCRPIPDVDKALILDVDTRIALERLKKPRRRKVDQDLFYFDKRQKDIFEIVNINFRTIKNRFNLVGVDVNKDIKDISKELERAIF